jgi:hypothetical protein
LVEREKERERERERSQMEGNGLGWVIYRFFFFFFFNFLEGEEETTIIRENGRFVNCVLGVRDLCVGRYIYKYICKSVAGKRVLHRRVGLGWGGRGVYNFSFIFCVLLWEGRKGETSSRLVSVDFSCLGRTEKDRLILI